MISFEYQSQIDYLLMAVEFGLDKVLAHHFLHDRHTVGLFGWKSCSKDFGNEDRTNLLRNYFHNMVVWEFVHKAGCKVE